MPSRKRSRRGLLCYFGDEIEKIVQSEQCLVAERFLDSGLRLAPPWNRPA